MLYWSVARQDLGLTSDEFYELQPQQLHALMKRWERTREHREYMLAQVAACVINFSMSAPKEQISTDDLMPSRIKSGRQDASTRRQKIDRDLVATQIRGAMDGLNQRRRRNG